MSEVMFVQLIPEGKWWDILYSSGFNLLNLLLCIVGADLFGKTSLIILTLVTLESDQEVFLNHNKSFRWHFGDYEKHNFFPFEDL